MPFTFESLSHPDIILITAKVYEDDRGYLLESYDAATFEKAGIDQTFVFDFYSESKKDVLRGLHVQTEPAAQAKLIHVSRGALFDVIVDVRPDSNRFGEHVTRRLTGTTKEIIFVPEGFAHGYLVLEDHTVVHYKGSCAYSPEHIRGLAWDSAELAIDWPIEGEPILSDQDADWPGLEAFERQ